MNRASFIISLFITFINTFSDLFTQKKFFLIKKFVNLHLDNNKPVMNMDFCVDIKDSILVFREEVKRNQASIDSIVDELLDGIIDMNSLLEKQKCSVLKLENELSKCVSIINYDDNKDLLEKLGKLIEDLIGTYVRIRKNATLYEGTKTQLLEYRYALSLLKETFSDIKISTTLKKDKEFNDLSTKLNELFS